MNASARPHKGIIDSYNRLRAYRSCAIISYDVLSHCYIIHIMEHIGTAPARGNF